LITVLVEQNRVNYKTRTTYTKLTGTHKHNALVRLDLLQDQRIRQYNTKSVSQKKCHKQQKQKKFILNCLAQFKAQTTGNVSTIR